MKVKFRRSAKRPMVVRVPCSAKFSSCLSRIQTQPLLYHCRYSILYRYMDPPGLPQQQNVHDAGIQADISALAPTICQRTVCAAVIPPGGSVYAVQAKGTQDPVYIKVCGNCYQYYLNKPGTVSRIDHGRNSQ